MKMRIVTEASTIVNYFIFFLQSHKFNDYFVYTSVNSKFYFIFNSLFDSGGNLETISTQ